MDRQKSLPDDHPTCGLCSLQQMLYKIWNGYLWYVGTPDQIYNRKKINITARTQIQTSHVHITLTGLDTALLVQWQERNPACENLASEIFNNSCLEDFWGTELKLELYPEIYAVKQKTKAVMVGVIVVVVVVVTAEW